MKKKKTLNINALIVVKCGLRSRMPKVDKHPTYKNKCKHCINMFKDQASRQHEVDCNQKVEDKRPRPWIGIRDRRGPAQAKKLKTLWLEFFLFNRGGFFLVYIYIISNHSIVFALSYCRNINIPFVEML